jgi:hypothetical protein
VVIEAWAPDPKNLVLLLSCFFGCCVAQHVMGRGSLVWQEFAAVLFGVVPASPAVCAAVVQVAGTLGRRLMLGQRKGLLVDKTTLDVNCKVRWRLPSPMIRWLAAVSRLRVEA